MERIIHKNQEPAEKERSPLHSTESQIFLQPKRISDDSRDAEMCDKNCDSEEELNVDVENDDTLCPVDLTRRQDKFTSFENLIPSTKTDSSSDFISFKDMKRAESVCSDDVSRSESPRDQSPSVVPHQNRRLAFSVENILDPNKFTGRQGVYSDGICCWKPHHDGSRGSPDYDDSETGEKEKEFSTQIIIFIRNAICALILTSTHYCMQPIETLSTFEDLVCLRQA